MNSEDFFMQINANEMSSSRWRRSKAMVNSIRSNMLQIANMCQYFAIQLLEEVEDYVRESNQGEELQESWQQINKWVGYLHNELCEDCKKELKISTTQEAKELFDSLCERTAGNAETLTTISVLKETFKYWGN